MKIWLLAATVALALVTLVLLGLWLSLRRAFWEIADELDEKLSGDTNTMISVSAADPAARALAARLNVQLRLLRRERHRYQQGDLELKEAVTNISHDLRTPLTAISGYLDLLEREEKSEPVQRYLSQIRNRTEAMKGLTEELFRYSVVTSTQELNPERLNLVRALEESLLSFYGAMREKGIRPQIALPEEPVWRQLDSSAVSRVFSNIINNALKYSDGDFSVVMEPDGSIFFSNTARNLNAVTVGRLFDRFYTVEASRNATGLGLSIARILTERMGGSIEADYYDEKLHIRIVFSN